MSYINVLLKLSCRFILHNSPWSLWDRQYFHYEAQQEAQAQSVWVNHPLSLSCFLAEQ